MPNKSTHMSTLDVYIEHSEITCISLTDSSDSLGAIPGPDPDLLQETDPV